jgi:adenylate cyclase
MQETSQKRMRIDLNRFKLHIRLDDAAELTLHFNSASRRFYLSVIALLVVEMKKQGKIFSVLLAKHLELLALLNETVGGSVGASTRESLLPRIYRKWKSALPDIENAPLFKIVGRNKYYDDGAAKTYRLGEAEKDSWANLFEYKGSEENVRLRFSIDALGAGLDDVVLDYGELTDAQAWQKFIDDQKKERDSKGIPQAAAEKPESETGEKKSSRRILRRLALAAVGVLIVGAVGFISWNYYLSRSQRVEPASLDKMAFPLPDKPSIAVLPFANLTGDPKQEYFSDGITEEIITALSKNPRLFVISRNSVFTYKDKPVKIQQVSEDLGVRYVLEGSVRKAEDRVRITAQLVDATTGNHVWSERYDRKLKDIFAIQDDITLEIMNAVHINLLEGEQVRHWHTHGTTNLQAYEKIWQARGMNKVKGTKEGFTRTKRLLEEAIALDPHFPYAYATLGWNYFLEARFGLSESPEKSIKMAFEYAQKAVELDDTLDWSHMLLASIYAIKRQFDKAVSEAKRAVSLNPNGADAYACLAGVIGLSGNWKESVAFGEKSIRLNPFPGVYYYHWLGRAYYMTEQYDKSIDTWTKALSLAPDYLNAHAFLSACYSSLNRQAEAAAAAKEVLRINPKFSLESYAKRLPYKNKTDIERYVSALRREGLPE